VLVWRLVRPENAPGLDGEGARLWGGRWNSVGVPMVYTASSLALAALEYFVHMEPEMRRKSELPKLIAVAARVPPGSVATFNMATLRRGYGIPDCQMAGDAWFLAQASLGLAVPSQVIPRENNILLNPRHLDMRHVTIEITEEFVFDDRMGM
jgi:RES domain-containing protein